MADMMKAPAAATAQGLRVSDQRDSSINPEHNATITNAQASLINKIKVHIAAGDKATKKAEDHYIAAGLHLKTLKANHTGTWEEWEALLKCKVGIGRSRASELMLIADGATTAEQVRADTNQRKLNHRKTLRSGTENPEPGNGDKPKPKHAASQEQRELAAQQAHIEELETAREHDQDLAEKLRAAEIKIAGLESEIEDLKVERDRLRDRVAELESAPAAGSATAVVKPKRGRPKGSKNKPKPPVAATTVNVVTPGPDLGNDPGPFPEILRRGPKAVSS